MDSNICPRAIARKFIPVLDQQIATIDPEDSIHPLVLERQILQARLDAYIYPVLSLPNEIVSEIFLHKLDRAGLPLSCSESPLFMGHICQKWRQIAISTPSLWTEIHLEVMDPTFGDKQLRLLDMWLTRSRSCPISIFLATYNYGSDLEPYSLRQFIETILPHRMRCHTLDVMMSTSDLVTLRGDFPMLRSLRVGYNELTADPHGLMEIFDDAPKLQKLDIYTSYALEDFSFRWEQMTHIVLRLAVLHDGLANVLRATVNLEILSVDIILAAHATVMERLPEIPPLRRLRELHLIHPPNENPGPESQMQLLDRLTLPALRILWLSEPFFTPDPVRSIVDLAARSSLPQKQLGVGINNARGTEEYYRANLPSAVGVIMAKKAETVPDSVHEEQ